MNCKYAKKVDISKLAYRYWIYEHNRNISKLTENEKVIACKEFKEIWVKMECDI